LVTARRELKEGSLAYAVRSSQECVELSLKGALRLLGVEYPKQHDVSRALLMFRERFPASFPTERMAEISRRLAERREPAMYGDELTMTPADLLFTREDGEEAVRMAVEALEAVRTLFEQYERAGGALKG
jgi:HEPN domain-containing protein